MMQSSTRGRGAPHCNSSATTMLKDTGSKPSHKKPGPRKYLNSIKQHATEVLRRLATANTHMHTYTYTHEHPHTETHRYSLTHVTQMKLASGIISCTGPARLDLSFGSQHWKLLHAANMIK